MESFLIFKLVICLGSIACITGWQFYTSLSDLTLNYGVPEEGLLIILTAERLHSEYWFGECKKKNKKYYTHAHLDHIDVLGKLIIRGWLNIQRIPTCILLRGTSYEEHLFRATAYNFQMCVPRITYCHSQKRYKYYYYEWYIPLDIQGGMNWDIFFFGPESLTWQ